MDQTNSRSPSPVLERHRLSSPTYDDQVNMSQQEMDAFDELDKVHYLKQMSSAEKRKRSITPWDAMDEHDREERKKRRETSYDETLEGEGVHVTQRCAAGPQAHQQEDSVPSDLESGLDSGASIAMVDSLALNRSTPPGFTSALVSVEDSATSMSAENASPTRARPTTALLSGFVSAASIPVVDISPAQAAYTPVKPTTYGLTSLHVAATSSHNELLNSSPDVPHMEDDDFFTSNIPEGATACFQSANALTVPTEPPDPAPTASPTLTSHRRSSEDELDPSLKLPTSGFTSAIRVTATSPDNELPNSSLDVPREQDTDFFTRKIPEGAVTGFQSARALVAVVTSLSPQPSRPLNPVLSSQPSRPLNPVLAAPPAMTSGRQSFDDELHPPFRPATSGFTSALHVATSSPRNESLNSSPDAPREQSTDFFTSKIPEGAVTGFQSAKALKVALTPSSQQLTEPLDPALAALPTFTSSRRLFEDELPPPVSQLKPEGTNLLGFSSAIAFKRALITGDDSVSVGKDWAKPSAEALARAAAKMKAWEAEIDNDFTVDPDDPALLEAAASAIKSDLARDASAWEALRAVENSFGPPSAPDSPSPVGTDLAKSGSAMGMGMGVGRLPALGKNKAFKSPLLIRPAPRPTAGPSNYVSSPLNPNGNALPATSASASTFRPPVPSAFTTPTPGTSSFRSLVLQTPSPAKSLGLTPRRVGAAGAAGAKPKFVTPFKPGMRPGQPGRLELGQSQKTITSVPNVTLLGSPRPAHLNHIRKGRRKYFDLTKPEGRQALESLRPQRFDAVELSEMGVDIDALQQITPETAVHYRFYSRSSQPPPAPEPGAPCVPWDINCLGSVEVLTELLNEGCDLVTKEWVDNHWGLILWKLAGTVCLEPEREQYPLRKRWCWEEVMRQFRYRYERELNSGSRPPVRLITTHDAPAKCPMVLCVSKITWHHPLDGAGKPVEPWVDVEMTDGWYRIRVAVDDPLERAIKKGTIRPGRKIAMQNAKLVRHNGTEPAEPLEAYKLMNLQICGNSCHLAPWHAKLGFMRHPTVATLDSLTSDGGMVTLLDVWIERVYPIAYMEFIAENGKKRPIGPLNPSEEAALQDRWQARRDAAAQKIRDDYDKKIQQWEGWAETFETRAGSQQTPANEDAFSSAEDQWMSLVDEPASFPEVKKSLTTDSAGWLAFYARQEIASARERMFEEIQRELESDFPPRDSRSFRVVVIKDARWSKREPFRTAQLHIWDVLKYTHSEGGKPGHFEEGNRFLVWDVLPGQKNAWMACEIDSVIYLSTTRSTRFNKMKN